MDKRFMGEGRSLTLDLSDITTPGSYRLTICLENTDDLILDAILSAVVNVEYSLQNDDPEAPAE